MDLKDLKDKLNKEFPKKEDPTAPDVWVTGRGVAVQMSNMSDRHLINTLCRIKRIAEAHLARSEDPNGSWRDYIDTLNAYEKLPGLEKEAIRRGYANWEKMRPNSVRDTPRVGGKPRKHRQGGKKLK